MPGLVAAKTNGSPVELRIWSAACATGQETWSVAMLLEEFARARQQPVPFRIIATDASEAALTAARRGVYEESALANVRLRHRREFFSTQEDGHRIVPRLQARVDFSTYDLLDEHSASPPAGLFGDFDLILCCNLLFYYRPPIRQQI